jgi:hypothetical protein
MTTGFGFCATCGTPRAAADQKFCAVCGSAISSAAPPPAPEPPAFVAPPPPPEPQAFAAPPAFPAPPLAPPPAFAAPPVAPPPVWPAPPYAGSPTYAAPSAPAAPRTGVNVLRRLLVGVSIVLVAALVATSWLGVVQVPVLSAAFGMDHPRDLGMVKDVTALDAFTSKWGIELPSPTQNYNLANKHHYSGSVQVDDTISEAALAAIPEYSAPNKIISQMQFRIHEGYIELSAFVNVPGYPASGPMYTQFSISATGSQTVAVDFSQLDFGRVGVPGNVVETVKTTLNEYLNGKILAAGVTIDTLQLHEGGIRFKGTWPQTITADPPKP